MENITITNIEVLLNAVAVATHFGVSKLTLRRMWMRGDFPAPLRIGRRSLRWRLTDIQRWISEHSNEKKENKNEQRIKPRPGRFLESRS